MPFGRLLRQVPPSQKNPDWQSFAPLHVLAQESPVHMLGAQLRMLPAVQTPAALQVLAAYSVDPVQRPGAHWVPAAYFRQAPLPLQAPSVPQVLTACCSHSLMGSWPSAMGLQAPAVLAMSQAWQMPVQALLQQIPSTQKPELHWAAPVQAAPLADRGAAPSGTKAPMRCWCS
jgi:hypothetical protein